jgi:Fur family transcriptional regulator, iron response regulator
MKRTASTFGPIAFAPTALAQDRVVQERLTQERLTQELLTQELLTKERAGEKHGALTGCPWHDVKAKLRGVGLRPTRQRMALGWILFGKGDRHVTAEMLYEEANRAKVPVSLATVYNTLHQFTEVGLLRQVAVDGSKTYFDTNASDHHHFFVEGEDALVDIPGAELILEKLPKPPEGYEVARVEVVVRLRRKDES